MNNYRSRRGQSGIVSIIAAILLVAGVMFVLTQTLGNLGVRAVDNSRQLDSLAALQLAESALQRAEANIMTAANGGVMSNSTCTAFATGTFSLGRGTFSYNAATVIPTTCSAASGTPCTSCTVVATGSVGSTSRRISYAINLDTVYGTTGTGQTVTMVVNNTSGQPARALFNLAWRRLASGSNSNATICTGCDNRWYVDSKQGSSSVGGMGITTSMVPDGSSTVVVQKLSAARPYAEVGVVFPGKAATVPSIVGSYWGDSKPSTPQTVGGKTALTGETNSGVATTDTTTCIASPNTYGIGSVQTCTSWCTGADTLVFGISARSGTSSVKDQVLSVNFNTSGTPSQLVPLTRIAHYPDPLGTVANATDVYSEIWMAYNSAYTSVMVGAYGSTTYNAAVKGYAGAFITMSVSNGSTTMSLESIVGQICVGNSFASGMVNTIQAVPGSTNCSSSTGTYTLSSAATKKLNSVTATIAGTTLYVVSSQGSLTFNVATSAPAVTPTAYVSPNYQLANPGAYVAKLTNITQGNGLSNTVFVPTGPALPQVGTRVAIFSGTGSLPANTTVQSVNSASSSYTISQAPTTGLIDAVVCGGTCAFFDKPSDTANQTQFTITKSTGDYWAGGFACLSGVDNSLVKSVSSYGSKGKIWIETGQ